MSLEKKHTLWDGLCRIVQSVFLAAEITVLADLLFAAGEKPLPRAAFWGLFLAAAAALSLWRGFTRKGRRIVFLSIAGAAALSALALFAAWSAAAPKTAYEAPETEPKAIFSEKRVLAVVPHEDDDLNLLSGVTGQFTDAGSEVYVVFVSTGDAAGLGEKRVYEAINALSLDGVPEENIIFLGYGDSIPDDGIHIYNAAPNAVTPSLSGRTETHAAPNHEAYREGTLYTRENLLGDLRSVIEEIRADVIFCVDYDENIDHRAVTMFFDEALGEILTAAPGYDPLVLKGFTYSTAFHAPADFYDSVNLLSTVNPDGERMENGVYCWDARVRLPMDGRAFSHSITECRSFAVSREYESQMLWRIAPRIINGDKVFWQRCTGSLLYGAAVRVSSGSGAELTDFRLLHSEDLAGRELPYSAVWTPENGDTAREAEFTFPAADVAEGRLYDNPSPEDNVLAAELVFPSGNRYAVGALDPAGTVVPVDEPDCEGFTVRLLETEGEHAGLTEAEAYSGAHDVMPPLIKLTDGDGNFIYDYRLSRGETEAVFSLYALSASDDLTGYTVTCEGEGCAAAVRDGTLSVTCPRGKSCTVTVTPAVYRIETAHTDSGDIPAWDTYPAKYEFFMPLTAKKAGLLLRSLEFRVKGYVPGTMRTVLRKYGSTTALADKFTDIVRGYNDVVLDMGSIALEKGVEYQLYFAASNNFYPPSVQPSWVAANDCIDIAHGSAYYSDDATLIFSGTVVLQET